MVNLYRSATVYFPENIQELEKTIIKHKENVIFAGGTHIMRYYNKYPKMISSDIICVDKLSQFFTLKKINEFVEVGAGVSPYKMLEVMSNYIPNIVVSAIMTLPLSVQKNISIAGSIIPDGIVYDITAALVCCGAIVEIHQNTQEGFVNKKIPLLEIYSNGIGKKKNQFISNVLIPKNKKINTYDFYKSYSSSFFNPEKSVVLCVTLDINEDIIENASVVLCYANKGVFYFAQTSNLLNDSVGVYLNSNSVNNIRKSLNDEIVKYFQNDSRNLIALSLFDQIIEEIQLEVL